MTSTGIIFTLMKNFQPGGANERSMLLTTLTQPSWGTSVKEATATMRTWRRFHKRTTEIGAALHSSDESTGRAYATGEQDRCPGNLPTVSGKSYVGGGL